MMLPDSDFPSLQPQCQWALQKRITSLPPASPVSRAWHLPFTLPFAEPAACGPTTRPSFQLEHGKQLVLSVTLSPPPPLYSPPSPPAPLGSAHMRRAPMRLHTPCAQSQLESLPPQRTARLAHAFHAIGDVAHPKISAISDTVGRDVAKAVYYSTSGDHFGALVVKPGSLSRRSFSPK